MNLKEYYNDLVPPLREQNIYTFFPKIRSACGRIIKTDTSELINFASCDYLGLSNNDEMKNAAIEAIRKYGTNISGSISLSGYTEYHEAFEAKLSKMYNGYNALMFTTSFLGNAGAISMIVGKDDIVLADKLCHSSLIHGIIVSGAKLRVYRHNDMNNLENLLKDYNIQNKKVLIVTDGVFSADGDSANLKDIVLLSEKYNAKIYVDDAHGVGVLGEKGLGLVESHDVLGRVDYILGTMSKAFGSSGGFLMVKDNLDYEIMKHLCSTYITSRSSSPGVVAASLKSLEINDREGLMRRKKVMDLSNKMTNLLRKQGLNLANTTTPIIPVIFRDKIYTGNLCKELINSGFLVSHFPPPYVEKNKSRLRIGMTYNHLESDINSFSSILKEIMTKQTNSQLL